MPRSLESEPPTDLTEGRARLLLVLFLVGLGLRVPGLLFGGSNDLWDSVLDWGTDVVALGLPKAFGRAYGVFSFALFGLAARLAEEVPRFWWLPYKAMVIAFEAGVLLALLRIVRPAVRRTVLFAYWLNPWFIWHGAYQGFWEGPPLLFGLLAVLALKARPNWRGWMLAGVLLFISGEFKPQGWIHFGAPLGVFLACEWWRGRTTSLQGFLAGFGTATLITGGWLWAGGASPWALADNLRTVLVTQPWLSNGGPGLWRFVSYISMQAQGISGEVFLWRFAPPWLLAVSGVVTIALAALFVAFARSLSSSGKAPASAAYLLITFGALAVSQFGLRAHLNHTYAALVLLIPLVIERRRWLVAWGSMLAVVALAHVSSYGMGSPALLPPDALLARYGHADALAAAVKRVPAFVAPDLLIQWQIRINATLMGLVSQQTVSFLSAGVFAAACVLASGLLSMARRGTGTDNSPRA
jgi:hypothetical protein